MPSPDPSAPLGREERESLARVARRSLRAAVEARRPPLPDEPVRGALARPGCSFVTLHRSGELRGCIGTLSARRALVDDVAANARSAALDDVRFPPVGRDELGEIEIEVAVLTPSEPLEVDDEEALLAALRPGVDGLLLEEGTRRSTFLPAVWEQLPSPRDFVAQLKRKAGLPADYWSPTLRFRRYRVDSFPAGNALEE